jgi:hypothetical protein
LGLVFSGATAKAATNHVVINEIAIDSVLGTGGTDDDWIELFNPTSQAVDLSTWSIQKSSAAGETFARQALSGSIPAGGHYLIVKDDPATNQTLKDAADQLVAASFDLSSNNIIFLVNDNVTIASPSDANIVDMVGYGTASFYETAPAVNPDEAKSIARVPEGVDTNNNANDFDLIDVPTPQNSQSQGGTTNMSGTVLLTVSADASPVQNLTPVSADLVFQVNGAGNAKINYGLTNLYGSSTALTSVLENADKTISLTGLACSKTYHYAIYAENTAKTQTDLTDDATFTTLPCGLTLNTLTMTKQSAKASNKYTDGWEWQFDLTIWNLAETSLKMKFDQWGGTAALAAASNMQFSVDNGTSWLDITANGAYSTQAANLTNIDNSASAGRQVKIIVRMKVPTGTKVGSYTSNYGILTE